MSTPLKSKLEKLKIERPPTGTSVLHFKNADPRAGEPGGRADMDSPPGELPLAKAIDVIAKRLAHMGYSDARVGHLALRERYLYEAELVQPDGFCLCRVTVDTLHMRFRWMAPDDEGAPLISARS